MKTKTLALYCLIGAVVLLMGHEYSSAEPKAVESVTKIGVVNIRKIFRDCKKNTRHRQEVLADQSKWEAEMEKLQKEIEQQKDGLRALKPGSGDYLTQMKELMQKQAEIEAGRQFNNQQRVLKDQRWTEDLYKEVLQITRELAEKKGLVLVFEKGEVEFPVASPDELMLTLSTHKLLYSKSSLDITDEVTARLDAEQ
jgi:Skp family chaperone for outer membrane proteins